MTRIRTCLAVIFFAMTSAFMTGCQSSNDSADMHNRSSSGTSAQIGTGTDTGTSGVSSGAVSPSK